MSDSTAKTVVRELGGFSLLREIGEGGMGKVFLARQKSLDRKVALKVLLPQLAKDEEFRTRFLREAKAAALFSHSNIVSVVDAGVDEAFGVHYIAFEFVEGGSLEDLLQVEPRLDEDRALEFSRGVLAGLSFAESKGIIHRDIKPDNVLVTPDGVPKVADLGLAKSPESMESQVTQTGVVLGTPLYMAPEQALGEDVLDIRTDLYAWGLCLWRMLTGLMPFNEEGGCSSLQILTKHINEDLVDVRERNPAVTEEVADFLRGLTARERDDRYPTAASALADLDRLLAGEALAGINASADAPPASRPSSRVSRASSRTRKSMADTKRAQEGGAGLRISPGLLGGILIGALGIGFGLALGTRGAPPASPSPQSSEPEVALLGPSASPTPGVEVTPAKRATPATTVTPVKKTPTTRATPVKKTPATRATPVKKTPATRATPVKKTPQLATVGEVAFKVDEKRSEWLDLAFKGEGRSLATGIRAWLPKVVPAARPELKRLATAFGALQAFAEAADAEDRKAAGAKLLAFERRRGRLATQVRFVVERLQRFVHLTTSLRTFALDLGPDRVLSFQRRLLADQSRETLRDYASLIQTDSGGFENFQRARDLNAKVKLHSNEVGHVAQALAMLSLIERINSWRATLANARKDTGFAEAPKRLFEPGGGRGVLFRTLRREPRLRLLLRAFGVIQAGNDDRSLFRLALKDVWIPAIGVFSLVIERADDSLSAVLLRLHDEHVGGEFIECRLQAATPNEFAPERAFGLVATGDLGQGALAVYFSKISRKLTLKQSGGSLGTGDTFVRIRVPPGGILRLSLEPTPNVIWVAHGDDGRAYPWSSKGKKVWKPGMPVKFQEHPEGGKAFWALAGEDSAGSLAQEIALFRELRALNRESSVADPGAMGRGGREGRSGRKRMTPEEREEFQNRMTPEERAEFKKRAQERKKKRRNKNQ